MQLWWIAYNTISYLKYGKLIWEYRHSKISFLKIITQQFCKKPGWLAATPSKINGHGASVQYNCNELHIIRWNLSNVQYWKLIWQYRHNVISYFKITTQQFCIKPGWLACLTFDINGHGASVWCNYDTLLTVRWYQSNLPHWKLIRP